MEGTEIFINDVDSGMQGIEATEIFVNDVKPK